MAQISKINNSIIQRIRDLHRVIQGPYDNLICEECSHTAIDIEFYVEYPCSTIQILDGK